MKHPRTPAAEAPRPGWYRARNGRAIQLVRKVNGRWRSRAGGQGIPYRAPPFPRAKDPAWRLPAYGYLPPDYPLLPSPKPRWA